KGRGFGVVSGLSSSGGIHTRPRLPSKGNRVNIPEPGRGYFCGDANELRDVGESPEKSSLFFLTVELGVGEGENLPSLPPQQSTASESGRPEKRRKDRKSALRFEAFGALSTALENRRERIIFSPGRTHNR